MQVGPPTGIETLEADTFRLECYQTPTGIKFLMLAEPRVSALDSLLKQIYSLYVLFQSPSSLIVSSLSMLPVQHFGVLGMLASAQCMCPHARTVGCLTPNRQVYRLRPQECLL
jgi:hypothetical protein